MLLRLLVTTIVLAGLADYVCCKAVNCGTGTPCIIDDENTTCDATAAAAAYCVYKTGSVCTDTKLRSALLAALKKKTPCSGSLTDTCQCQKAYIEDTITCGTKKKQLECVYKASAAGCGGNDENYAAAKQYASNVVTNDTGCTGLTETCKCEVNYYANPGSGDTEKCMNAKQFLDCVTAVKAQADKGCDNTKTATDIKTVASKTYTGLTCSTATPVNVATTTPANNVTTTPSGAACLEYPLVTAVILLGLLTKMK